MTDAYSSVLIDGGKVVTPTETVEGTIRLSGKKIESVNADSVTPAERRVEANGALIMPGFVDIHGDDIEQHLFPREHAEMPPKAALRTADKTNLTAGVTTKFHAIPFETEPEKNRSIPFSANLARLISDDSDLVIDHRVNARCRVSEPEAVWTVQQLVTEQRVDLLSIGTVEPGKGQFTSPDRFIEWYSGNVANCREPDYTAQEAQHYISENPQTVDGTLNSRIKQIADKARNSEVVLISHDDESSVEVNGMCQHGAVISEYPVTSEAAMTATESGMTTAMGAPNLVQDGSLFGNLDAAEAIDSGLLDVLCVDYYPPSMLASVFVDTGEALHQRVSRVTQKPADAVGLTDRGRLETGCRADIVVIDPNPCPTVEYVFVGGKPVYQREVIEDGGK